MPKACKKKSSEFEASPVKSVFLFGKPNKGKLDLLWQMKQLTTPILQETGNVVSVL